MKLMKQMTKFENVPAFGNKHLCTIKKLQTEKLNCMIKDRIILDWRKIQESFTRQIEKK